MTSISYSDHQHDAAKCEADGLPRSSRVASYAAVVARGAARWNHGVHHAIRCSQIAVCQVLALQRPNREASLGVFSQPVICEDRIWWQVFLSGRIHEFGPAAVLIAPRHTTLLIEDPFTRRIT